jgi:hypothetical protein
MICDHQAVGRHERLEGHVIDVRPVAHHFETAEQIDIFLLCGRGDKRNHGLGVRLGNHLRCKLRVDEYDIGADPAVVIADLAEFTHFVTRIWLHLVGVRQVRKVGLLAHDISLVADPAPGGLPRLSALHWYF